MWCVRSNSHVDYAWLRKTESGVWVWMYSHSHATKFETPLEATHAAIEAEASYTASGFDPVEYSIVSDESLDTLYGEKFAKLVRGSYR